MYSNAGIINTLLKREKQTHELMILVGEIHFVTKIRSNKIVLQICIKVSLLINSQCIYFFIIRKELLIIYSVKDISNALIVKVS